MRGVLVSGFLLIVSLVNGQIEKLIVEDNCFVVGYNSKKVTESIKGTSIERLEFFKSLDSAYRIYDSTGNEFNKYDFWSPILRNPEDVGISVQENSYMAISTKGYGVMISFYLPISDSAKFIKLWNAHNSVTVKYQLEGFKMVYSSDESLGVLKDGYFMCSYLFVYPNYRYQELSHYPKRRALIVDFVERSFNDQGSILSDTKFIKVQAEEGNEMFASLDFEVFADTSLLRIAEYYTKKEYQVQDLNDWSVDGVTASFSLKKDTSLAEMEFFVDAEIGQDLPLVFDENPNPDLFKYFLKDSLYFFSSISIAPQKLIPLLRKSYEQGAQFMNLKYRSRAESFYSVFDLVFKQKDILSLFQGDFALGAYGFDSTVSTYMGYEYDENYNRKKVEKSQKVKFLKMVIASTINEPKRVQNMLNIMCGYGVLTREGGYYLFRDRMIDYYIFLEGDVLIVTTIKELALNKRQGYDVSLIIETPKNSVYAWFKSKDFLSYLVKDGGGRGRSLKKGIFPFLNTCSQFVLLGDKDSSNHLKLQLQMIHPNYINGMDGLLNAFNVFGVNEVGRYVKRQSYRSKMLKSELPSLEKGKSIVR